MYRTQFILIIFLFCFSTLKGQKIENLRMSKDDLEVLEIDKAINISSASRSNKEIKDIPSTVFIITNEVIRDRGYITLMDVLKSTPGIRISQPGSALEGDMFIMRGLVGNSYVKILIDNIPIQPFVSGLLPIGEQIPVSQAERIEIVYGPSSAVYGADAMAGVINIITNKKEDKSYAKINSFIGQNNYHHTNFMAGGKAGIDKNTIHYNFYGNFSSISDFRLKFDQRNIVESKKSALELIGISKIDAEELVLNNNLTNEILSEAFPYYRGSFDDPQIRGLPRESRLLGASISYKNFNFSFNELFRSEHSSTGRNPFVYSFYDTEGESGETIRRVSLSYNKRLNDINLIFNSSYLVFRQNKDSFFQTTFETAGEGKSYFHQASSDLFGEALFQYNIKNHSEITIGASYLFVGYLPITNSQIRPINHKIYKSFSTEKKVLDNDIGEFGYDPDIANTYGGFAQYFYKNRKLTFLSSIRFDIPSEYPARIYSRVGSTYDISKKITFRASFGYAFKSPAPNLTYSSIAFNDTDSDSLRYEFVPNIGLKPEQLIAYEAGLRFEESSNFIIDISFFNQSINKLITARSMILDRDIYPLASVFEEDGIPRVRSYINSNQSQGDLTGIQLSTLMKGKVFERKFSSQLNISISNGSETLPENGRLIGRYRMQPIFITNFIFSLNPINKVFLNLENNWLSDWYKRAAPSGDFDEKDMEIKGYFNADFTARYRLNNQLDCFVKINNIFNSEIFGIGATSDNLSLFQNPQVRRFIKFGLSFSTKTFK